MQFQRQHYIFDARSAAAVRFSDVNSPLDDLLPHLRGCFAPAGLKVCEIGFLEASRTVRRVCRLVTDTQTLMPDTVSVAVTQEMMQHARDFRGHIVSRLLVFFRIRFARSFATVARSVQGELSSAVSYY